MSETGNGGPVDRTVGRPALYVETVRLRNVACAAGDQAAEDKHADCLDDLWHAMTPDERLLSEALAELDRLRAERDALRRVTLVGWVETDGELIWQDRAAAVGRNLYVRLETPEPNASFSGARSASAGSDS